MRVRYDVKHTIALLSTCHGVVVSEYGIVLQEYGIVFFLSEYGVSFCSFQNKAFIYQNIVLFLSECDNIFVRIWQYAILLSNY